MIRATCSPPFAWPWTPTCCCLPAGVSVGKYDFAAESLLALGAEFLFTGALIQPGKPVIFGRLPHASGMKYFFALPGNPVSTMVTFALFVHPLLCALAGDDKAVPRFVLARLASEVRHKPGSDPLSPRNADRRARSRSDARRVARLGRPGQHRHRKLFPRRPAGPRMPARRRSRQRSPELSQPAR